LRFSEKSGPRRNWICKSNLELICDGSSRSESIAHNGVLNRNSPTPPAAMFLNVTVRTLSEALLQLHRSGMRDDFPNRLFACLKSCFFCDFYSYDESAERQSQRVAIYPATAVNVDLLSGWIDQRPDIHGIYKYSGPPGILRFCTPFGRCSSELHDELLVLLGQRHQLSGLHKGSCDKTQ
jgi:hypothetical protein